MPRAGTLQPDGSQFFSSRQQKSAWNENWERGEASPMWKGGTRVAPSGYRQIIGGRGPNLHLMEHVAIVERALGRKLPTGAVIHHVNGNKADNRSCNLVVLQSDTEHQELHRKMAVRAAGGNPHTDRLCSSCGPRSTVEFFTYQSKAVVSGFRYSSKCRACFRAYDSANKRKARASA